MYIKIDIRSNIKDDLLEFLLVIFTVTENITIAKRF